MISCSFAQTYWSFQEDGKYGFKDENNKIVIAPEYDYAFDFADGIAIVQRKGLWGFINAENKAITKCEYLKCGEFDGNCAMVLTADGLGMCSLSGEIIVDPKFDDIEALDNGMFLVTKNYKLGLYAPGKGLVLDPKFEEFEHLRKDFFGYRSGDHYGVISGTGELIGDPVFIQMPYCSQDIMDGDTAYYFRARTKSKAYSSYMTANGKIFIDGTKYTTVYGSPLHYKILETKNEDDYKVVSLQTGETVIDPIQNKLIDIDWRPCDGWGYESTPFVTFGTENNCEFYSVTTPSIAFKGLTELPSLSENMMFVKPGNTGYSVYTWEGKELATNTDVSGYLEARFRICPDHEIKITQNGKIAVRESSGNSLKFLKKGTFSGETYFFGISVDQSEMKNFKMVNKNKKEKAYVYIIYNENVCYYYLLVDGFQAKYLSRVDDPSEIKIGEISVDQDKGVAHIEIDFQEEGVELMRYKL